MTLKQYLIIMIIGSILCWIAWWLVVLNIDPFQDTGVGLSFFYASLFLALLGTISIFSFLFRKMFSKMSLPMFHYVHKSFKDSLLISILVIGLLYLQGINFLRWWNAGILIIVILLYSIFTWISKKENGQISYS